MGAFKQFTTKDIIISPFKATRDFSFSSNDFSNSDVQIEFYKGVNQTSSFFTSESAAYTGFNSLENEHGVYNSIKQLYYTNYTLLPTGDLATTASIIPGATPEYDVEVGPTHGPRFENYLQTSLSQSRYFPTGSGDYIKVISIPSQLFGNNIVPNTFTLSLQDVEIGDYLIEDDGEGNLISDNDVVGQIFYPHGLAVVTTGSVKEIIPTLPIDTGSYTTTLNFSSSFDIFETEYKCTINENEYQYSLNNSLISGSDNKDYKSFVTGSDFTPYITSVGLYSNKQELLAVAKLSNPLPVSKFNDTTIMINMDR